MDPMKVVVWQFDGALYDDVTYASKVVELFRVYGLEPDVVDGTRMKELPEADLHVLAGGVASATEAFGWVPKTLKLVKELLERSRKSDESVMGLGLGTQLIAQAHAPGSVISTEELRVGTMRISFRSRAGLQGLTVPVFHHEVLDPALLSSAHVFASNPRGEVLGFHLQDRPVIGTLYLPELDPETMKRLTMARGEFLQGFRVRPIDVLTDLDIHKWAYHPEHMLELVELATRRDGKTLES